MIMPDGTYDTTNAAHADRLSSIGIVRKVVTNKRIEVAYFGSVIPKLVGNTGDKIYLTDA